MWARAATGRLRPTAGWRAALTSETGSLLTPVAERQIHRRGQPAALHQAPDVERSSVGIGAEDRLAGAIGALPGLDQRAVAHPERGLVLVPEAVGDADRRTADVTALGRVVGR